MRISELIPELTDGVVGLRPARADDDPRIVEACRDPETATWLGHLPQPYREADAREWRDHVLADAASGNRVPWVVADPGTDELLGAMDLFSIRDQWDAELGYWTHPAARGRGLTTAAARLVLAHAFRPVERGGLGLVRLQAVVAVGNTASTRVLEKLGMQRAGTFRAYLTTRTGRADAALFDVLRD